MYTGGRWCPSGPWAHLALEAGDFLEGWVQVAVGRTKPKTVVHLM